MNKYIKLLMLNASVVIIATILYSPGLLALYPTDVSIIKAGMSIIFGLGLIGIFGYGNLSLLEILPQKTQLSLTTEIKDMSQAKQILNSYKGGKYFGSLSQTSLEQLNRLDRSSQRVKHEIDRKFDNGSLSNSKYSGIVDNALQTALQNVITMANRMQLFDEQEYERLQHYKEDNIPDDIQEKQIALYKQNMELIKQAIEANEHLILGLDTLTVELAKPGEQDDSILQEIEKLTNEVKYYT